MQASRAKTALGYYGDIYRGECSVLVEAIERSGYSAYPSGSAMARNLENRYGLDTEKGFIATKASRYFVAGVYRFSFAGYGFKFPAVILSEYKGKLLPAIEEGIVEDPDYQNILMRTKTGGLYAGTLLASFGIGWAVSGSPAEGALTAVSCFLFAEALFMGMISVKRKRAKAKYSTDAIKAVLMEGLSE